jgi:hypothetical protein
MNIEQVYFILWISAAIAAITHTITGSDIFRKPRRFINEKLPFIGGLFTCAYCLAHCISLAVVLIIREWNGWDVMTCVAHVFAFVALSTIIRRAFPSYGHGVLRGMLDEADDRNQGQQIEIRELRKKLSSRTEKRL